MLPETGGITRVYYYLDGATSEFKRESRAPYDLNGGPASGARPYDTTALSDGAHTIRAEVLLNTGQFINFDTHITVANQGPPQNSAPVLNTIGNQSVQAGSSKTVNISASDADNDTLTITAIGVPNFASFTDNGNGTASLVLNPTTANVGSSNITVTVSDGALNDSETFTITVTDQPPQNSAPVLNPIGNQSVQAGNSKTIAISASDIDNDTLTITAIGVPGFASFTDNGNGTASLQLDPLTADTGNYNVTVTVSDGALTDTETIQITITAQPPQNSAPVLNPISNQSVQANNNKTIAISASDADNDTLTITASGVPNFASFTDNGNGTASLVLNPTATNVGSSNITVTVSDGTLTDSETIQITVTAISNSPYSLVSSPGSNRVGQTPLEGAIVSGDLYGRMIPETGGITRVFYYLDGSGSQFKSEFKAPYDLNGGPSSGARPYDTTALSDGAHTIRAEVLLNTGEFINFDTNITVANQGPPQNSAPVLNSIGNQSVQANNSKTVSISASDADNDTLTINASGVPNFASFTDNGNGTASLVLNPTTANVGSSNITVTVSDGTLSDSEIFQITVNNPQQVGSLEITEFLASNKGTFAAGEDWVEIHNNGSSDVDLTGWCVTDDVTNLAQWCFTSGNLAVDGYLVVIADNIVPAQALHTNFKLKKGGEYLALVKPDGTVTSEFSPQFPQQYDDISYGINSNGDLRYFSTPTPGAANGAGVTGFLSFNPGQLTLAVGSGTAVSQSILSTLSGVTEAYTLSTDDGGNGWLSAVAQASDDGVTPDTIDITADASGLAQGTYTGTVTAQALGYGDGVLNVTFTVTTGGGSTGSLELTEFMASNGGTFSGGADWIEIHNNGSSTVDLTGWCLTDTATDLSLWCFPNGSLVADGYLVVIADKGDPLPLHTNFKLGAGGEYLALVKPDGTIATEYAPLYPAQTTDVSYGINPAGDLRFFTTPTPGAPNNDGVTSLVSVVSVSHERGFYTSPIQVSITMDVSVDSIRYTTDGSEPTEVLGQVYSGTPISISSTTILRVAAITGGAVAEKVTSHSYIFLNDVIQQSGMNASVVSDYSSEIIPAMEAIPTMSIAANPGDVSQFYNGDDIEKPVSVEILYAADPALNHQANSGIESHSHNRAKRSLRLNFRAIYGDAKFNSDLLTNAPLNGDTASGKYDKLILRGGNNRCWCRDFNPDKTTYTIDQFYRDTQIAANGTGMRGTFVHLYINGEYYGLYNAVERADKHFLSDYLGGDKEDWFSTNHGIVHDGADPLNGDRTRYDYLTTTLVNNDMSVPANYAELQEYLEIDQFIDYLLATWWAGVGDWPDNNWYAGSRNPTSLDGTTGLMFFAWDGEWSWDAPADFSNSGHRAKIHPAFRSDKGVSDFGTPAPDNSFMIAQIWHAARQSPVFMSRVEARANVLLGAGGVLSDGVARTRWTTLTDFVFEAVIGESARWGDKVSNPPRTRDIDWQNEADAIFNLIGGNANELQNQLRSEGYIP